MDDKQKVLEQEWEREKAALQRAQAAFNKAESDYLNAVKTTNRVKMEAGAAGRRSAADRLRSAQVAEARARYLCGEDYTRDSLRRQVGEDHSLGRVYKLPERGR
jgi:hypothetical protein